MPSSTRIKFCGLRRPEDVALAVQWGADYLGFVFVESSPRALTLDDAERLISTLSPASARRVGVFQDASSTQVREAVERCQLDLVQLHGRESVAYAEGLDVPVIVVRRVPVEAPAASDDTPPVETSATLPANTFAVLVDAHDAHGRSGGLGLRADETAFESVRASLPAETRLFLAGGLTPENVGARVRRLRPYAVDVSSGVESAPGIKNAARMRAFAQALEEAE